MAGNSSVSSELVLDDIISLGRISRDKKSIRRGNYVRPKYFVNMWAWI